MEFNTKTLNTFEVEPVKIVEEKKENILGYDMFPLLYNNIFLIAKKKSGKSNVIYNILDKGANKHTNILFFVPTFHRDAVYMKMAEMLDKKKINYQVFSDIIEDGVNVLDDIIKDLEAPEPVVIKTDGQPVRTMFGLVKPPREKKEGKGKKAPKHIIVLDDCGNSLKNSSVTKLLKINRHLHARVIISSQHQGDMFQQAFRQMDNLIIFRGLSSNVEKLEQIYRNADLSLPFEEFVSVYRFATLKPFSFLYIDTRNNQYRVNFNKEIELE